MRATSPSQSAALKLAPSVPSQPAPVSHVSLVKPLPPPPPAPVERPSAGFSGDERPHTSAIRRMILARRQRRLAKLAPPIIAVVSLAEAKSAHAYMGDQLLNTASNYFIAPLFILSVVCAGVASLFRPEYVKVAAYSAFICVGVFTVIKLAQPLMSAVSA